MRERIPRLFDNFQHLEHLDLEAAQAAILRPLEVYNLAVEAGQPPVAIEPALVEAVLDQAKTRSIAPGLSGDTGIVEDTGLPTTRIETPLLQLVMTRLWSEEMIAGSRTLRLETLHRLGGVRMMFERAVDELMADLSPEEQRVATDILHFLVTPSGATIPQSVPDLALYSGRDEPELAAVLDRLASARIVRPLSPSPGQTEMRFEIFHDVLARPLLVWVRDNTRATAPKPKLFRGLRRR